MPVVGENTPSHFTCPMPGAMTQLFGKWEAALTEVAIPLTRDIPTSAVNLTKMIRATRR